MQSTIDHADDRAPAYTCLRCGYPLADPRPDRPCPECGEPMGPSLDALRGVKRVQIEMLLESLRLLIWTPIIVFAGLVFVLALEAILGRGNNALMAIPPILLLAALVLLVGTVGVVEGARRIHRRSLVRFLLVIPPVAAGAMAAIFAGPFRFELFIAAVLICVVVPGVLMWMTAHAIRRALAHFAHERGQRPARWAEGIFIAGIATGAVGLFVFAGDEAAGTACIWTAASLTSLGAALGMYVVIRAARSLRTILNNHAQHARTSPA